MALWFGTLLSWLHTVQAANADDATLLAIKRAIELGDVGQETDRILSFGNGSFQSSQIVFPVGEEQVESNSRSYDDILTHRQDFLESLVQGHTVNADELHEDFDVIQAFDEVMAGMRSGILQQKALAMQANQAIYACNRHLKTAHDEFLILKETKYKELQEDHKSCRLREGALVVQKSRSCPARDAGLDLARSPPSCMSQLGPSMVENSVRQCIIEAKEWTTSIPDLDAQETECKNFESELAVQTLKCNVAQMELESHFCAYTEELHLVCIDNDMCVNDAVLRRNHLFDAVERLVQQNKHIFIIMNRIKCITSQLEQVVNKEVNASGLNITECSAHTVSIPDDLNVTLEASIPVDGCDEESAVARRPGTEEWIKKEFAELDQGLLVESKSCDALPSGAKAFHSCAEAFRSGQHIRNGPVDIVVNALDGTSISMQLFCDMESSPTTKWTLVGKVYGDRPKFDDWLRSFHNTEQLQALPADSGAHEDWSSVPAVDMAVNYATHVRISTINADKFAWWEMHEDRSVATWWDRSAGPSVIYAAAQREQSTVTVRDQDGNDKQCFQNSFGIMALSAHFGSYPAATVNWQGNTGGHDLCMAVCGSGASDGFGNNGNGCDAPIDANLPNHRYGNANPRLLVWLGSD